MSSDRAVQRFPRLRINSAPGYPEIPQLSKLGIPIPTIPDI